jgi:HSP20 family protein
MSLLARNDRQGNDTSGLSRPGFFSDDLDRVFDRLLAEPRLGLAPMLSSVSRMGSAALPAIDITESDGDVRIAVELPGVKPEDVDIRLTGTTLTLSGEKKDEREEKDENRYYSERTYGSFRRSVTLPESIDPDSIEAEHDDGVLMITAKKAAPETSRKISVKRRA